jgi:hypothetical protein
MLAVYLVASGVFNKGGIENRGVGGKKEFTY